VCSADLFTKSRTLLSVHDEVPSIMVQTTAVMHIRLCFLFAVLSILVSTHAVLIESERLAEYHARNYSWPPSEDEFVPQTAGWTKLYQRRLKQVDAITVDDNCYNGYMSAIHSGIVCPNFTEFGYGLTSAPKAIISQLNQILHAALEQNTMRDETLTECIKGAPKFIDISPKILDQSLLMLQPLMEAWSGTKLIANNAYGLRVYMNESKLNMHIDKVETHVISAIMHVDHDQTGEPWPIVIEDFQGNTVEVNLEAGDILLYESSKCYHGRPRPFNGEWYTSLFLHWYPVDWDPDITMKTHYRVPPTWDTKIPSEFPTLHVIETSLDEPECQHGWCGLQESIVFSGPAPGYGKVMAGGKVEELKGLISEQDLTKMTYEDVSSTDEEL